MAESSPTWAPIDVSAATACDAIPDTSADSPEDATLVTATVVAVTAVTACLCTCRVDCVDASWACCCCNAAKSVAGVTVTLALVGAAAVLLVVVAGGILAGGQKLHAIARPGGFHVVHSLGSVVCAGQDWVPDGAVQVYSVVLAQVNGTPRSASSVEKVSGGPGVAMGDAHCPDLMATSAGVAEAATS